MMLFRLVRTMLLFVIGLFVGHGLAMASDLDARDLSAQAQTVDTNASMLASMQQSSTFADNEGRRIALGFVNLRRVMAAIPQMSNMLEHLKLEFSGQYQALQKESDKLRGFEEKLAALPRGSDDYFLMEKQVVAMRRELARMDTAYRDAYSVRRNEELAKLQEIVLDEIISLAKDEGYDVILNDTGVIYVSSKADLTNKVIMKLQKRSGGLK